MLRHALAYARSGWPVFPLQGKKPLPGTHGVKDATCDPVAICNAFRGPYNIGIACGEQAGIVVVDVDGIQGIKSMQNLTREHGREFTYTPTVRTANGYHLYFRYTDVRNHVRLLDGIDIRSTGGYVVAPPSVHESGKKYTWVRGPEFPMLEFPSQYLIHEKEQKRQEWKSIAGAAVGVGSRNQTLTSVAGAVARGVDLDLAGHLVHSYNQVYLDPPLDDIEVNTIINSVFSIEKRRRCI